MFKLSKKHTVALSIVLLIIAVGTASFVFAKYQARTPKSLESQQACQRIEEDKQIRNGPSGPLIGPTDPDAAAKDETLCAK